MKWVLAACALAFLVGEVFSVRAGDPVYLEQAGGIIAIAAAMGAMLLLFRSAHITQAAQQLQDLQREDIVGDERAQELVSGLQQRDRLDQLTLIMLSAVSSALQAFAGAALAIGQTVVGWIS